MKIYLDLVLFTNGMFDFFLLFGVNYLLKRNAKLHRIILGSLVGALSIFFLFIKINTLTLFILKVFISIIMILITFKYQSISYFIKNFLYLYILSIFLGGFLYFINSSFSYKQEGLIFFNNGFSLNIIIILIISPLIIYFYVKEHSFIKNNNTYYKKVSFTIFNQNYCFNAYIDTGNKLKYYGSSVILVYLKDFNYETNIYIPYETIKDTGLLKGYRVDIYIDDKLYKNKLIGITNKSFSISNVKVILPDCYL